MRKLTVSLFGMALLLFAFSVPAVYAQDCNNDTDCPDDGLFCNGIPSCSTETSTCVPGSAPCESSLTCDEDSDSCVECLIDDNCTEETPYCVGKVCVECDNDTQCDDGLFCNGAETCDVGSCAPGVSPCDDGLICDEESNTCAACDNDTQCNDGVYCNGSEYCSDGSCLPGKLPCPQDLYCLEDNQTCVECLADSNCDDQEFCNGLEICNETSGQCEDGDDPCEEPLFCDNETESCVECFEDDDCSGDNNTPYCDDSLSCVECIVSDDCDDNETCREGVCGVTACELKIRPKKVRISKMFRPMQRKFKIKGGEGFDPYGEIDFGFLQPYVKKVIVTKKGKLKVWVITPTGARLFKGPLEIRVGDCVGEVLFK